MAKTRHVSQRVAFQRRRHRPSLENNSVPRAYDLLRSHLHSLEPGSVLVEIELARMLSCSRSTIRAALALMVQERLVERRTRTGTIVLGSAIFPLSALRHDNDAIFAAPGALMGQEENISYRITSGVATAATIHVPEMLQRWLRLEADISVAVISSVICIADEPVGTSVGYVALPPGQPPPPVDLGLGTFGFIKSWLNIPIGDSEFRLAAVPCDVETAARLGIEPGAPTLWIEDFIRDLDRHPRAIRLMRLRGDRCTVGSTLP